MIKGRTWTRELQGREMRALAASRIRQRDDLPTYQTRSCAHCGLTTTFALDDPVGGWYVCLECGRYA
jgi:hypothetical protein